MKSDSAFAYPYAKAIFEIAQAKKQIKEWDKALLILVSCLQSQDVDALCKDQRLPIQQRANFFLELCKLASSALPDGIDKLILLLFRKNRLVLLSHIVTIYQKMEDDYEQTLRVRVTVAQKLSETMKQQMLEALAHRFKRKIDLQCEIDASLLGGAIIYINDKVIDNSVLTKLQQFKNLI